MLSLLKTFPFAFNKRSFIIGFIILFFGTFFVFGEFCWVFHLAKENIQPTREHTQLLSIIAYLIKLIGYSILFSYVFIKAKQDAYNLPKTNPSSEFLIRVFLTIFCVQLLTDILLILSGYVFVQHYMNAIYSNPNIIIDKSFIMKHLVFPFVLLFIPISYILCHFWIPYLMNFNFSRFGYKLIQTFKRPLVYLQILGLSILYSLIVAVPLILITLSADKLIQGLNPFRPITSGGFYVITILLGLFLVLFYTVFKIGRLLGVLYTILFLITGALIKYILGLFFPFEISFPVLGVLCTYCWFCVMCFIFTLSAIVIPTGIIHLLAQGAFQINKAFNPNLEKKDDTPITPEIPNEQQEDSGWIN